MLTKRRRFLKNKKGMSIVISTVIIVAVSITMAIAVAFWAMGIGNSLTKFEKLEIVSAYAENYQNFGFVGTGSGATAVANVDLSGVITSITVTNGGSGYTSGATVSIISVPGGGGVGAFARASVAGGVITRIDVISGGSGYTIAPTVSITSRPVYSQNYPVYLKIKNTGSAAATINNVFLDGKPYDAPSVNAPTPKNLFVTVAVGNTIGAVSGPGGYTIIYLPYGSTWNSGDYVEIEIQTAGGRIYSTTVVLP
jgi:hypothetical protein